MSFLLFGFWTVISCTYLSIFLIPARKIKNNVWQITNNVYFKHNAVSNKNLPRASLNSKNICETVSKCHNCQEIWTGFILFTIVIYLCNQQSVRHITNIGWVKWYLVIRKKFILTNLSFKKMFIVKKRNHGTKPTIYPRIYVFTHTLTPPLYGPLKIYSSIKGRNRKIIIKPWNYCLFIHVCNSIFIKCLKMNMCYF